MKITLSRETLLDLLSNVIGAVEKRHTNPVLENVLIQVEQKTLRMTTTDLEIEMSASTPAYADETGEITVPAKKLLDICKAMPKDCMITLSLNAQGRLLLQGLRNRFELSTLPAIEFPLLDQLQFDQSIELDENTLKGLLSKTSFAMANQDVRYYLNGLLFDIGHDYIAMAATDGHRLAVSKLADIQVENTIPQQIIIPRKAVQELTRLLKNREQSLTLHISSKHIRLQTDNVQFTSKLIDGRYPDYQAAIPASLAHSLHLDRLELRDSLMRAAILSNAAFKGVRLQLNNGVMLIQSSNPERESAEEELDINYSGDTLEIGFNVTYLLDAINHLGGESIFFDLSGAESSTLLYDPEDEQTRYVVMPIRL
jgi:DNA polymerase-3 subunit beta